MSWTPLPDEPHVEVEKRFDRTPGRGGVEYFAGYAVRYRRRLGASRRCCDTCGKACVPKKDGSLHGHKCDAADRDNNLYRELMDLYATPGKALAAVYDSAAHIGPPSQQIEMRAAV